MKHLIHLCLCLVLLCPTLNAQDISRSVIGAAGESSQGSTITLDWTLGETATSTLNHDKGMLTEGFQQPYLQIEAIETAAIPFFKNANEEVEVEHPSILQINAYPNPVSAQLWVEMSTAYSGQGFLQLLNAEGKNLLEKTINLDQEKVNLNMSSYASGSYYLIVRNADQAILKTLKITKIY